MNLKCPIYDTTGACDKNKNCLFLRQGGCAIILGMKAALKNQEILEDLERRLSAIEQNVSLIARFVSQR